MGGTSKEVSECALIAIAIAVAHGNFVDESGCDYENEGRLRKLRKMSVDVGARPQTR